MQTDAAKNDDLRWTRVKKSKEQDQREAEEEKEARDRSAAFLDDMAKDAFGMNHNHDKEEMARRKHYTRQKGDLDEAASFQQ